MRTSTRRSTVPATRSAPRSGSPLAVALLLLAGACTTPATAPPPAAPPASPGVPGDPGTPGGPEAGLPSREPVVRVGLLVDTTTATVTATSGFEVTPLVGGAVLLRGAQGDTLSFSADSGGGLLFRKGAGGEWRRASGPVVVRPDEGSLLSVSGKPYRGAALVRPGAPGRLTVVNLVDMETYLLGVVPREIGKVGLDLLEASKAQAVAARTYAVSHLGGREQHGFDFYATVQDQVYGGVAAEHEPVSRAVTETAGEILTYQGVPIEAYYHSTCAGRTAAIEEVWNAAPRPYLVSVVDVNPQTGIAWDSVSSRFRWTERWTIEQMDSILARTLADSLPAGVTSVGKLRDMEVLERTPSGRVKRMRIETSNATFHVGRDRVRWILPTMKGAILNSSLFDIEVVRGAGGAPVEVVATGQGWGHGIGMCQVGAMGRARAGQDYRTILSAYYPGTELRDLY